MPGYTLPSSYLKDSSCLTGITSINLSFLVLDQEMVLTCTPGLDSLLPTRGLTGDGVDGIPTDCFR